MVETSLHVLFYALVAAASPVELTATLVVIRNDRPRVIGVAFLGGFLVGTTVAVGLGLVLGDAAVNGVDSHDQFEAVLALLLGVVLVAVGLRARRRPTQVPTPRPQEPATLARLRHVRPASASAVGAVLGFGGPKRLVLTFLAMSLVSAALLGDVESATLVVLYVAVASLAVWVPIGMVLVAGDQAAALLHRFGRWLERHGRALRVWVALGAGVALVTDGLLRLVA